MTSSIYRGTLVHVRTRPITYRFKYSYYFIAFDLNEIEKLSKEYKFFSINKFNLISLFFKDFLENTDDDLLEKLSYQLDKHLLNDKVNNVSLLTIPRVLGYAFNPVSFFFCYDNTNKLLYIVVQICNTYGQRHIYLLDNLDYKCGYYFAKANKNFFVSPFNTLEGYYEFNFHFTEKNLSISIDLKIDKTVLVHSFFTGTKYKMDGSNLLKLLAFNPLTAALSRGRIAKHAIFLRLKGLKAKMKPSAKQPDTLVK